MNITKVIAKSGQCGGGDDDCPAVYDTDTGHLIFQLKTPPLELLGQVRIPSDELIGVVDRETARMLVEKLTLVLSQE